MEILKDILKQTLFQESVRNRNEDMLEQHLGSEGHRILLPWASEHKFMIASTWSLVCTCLPPVNGVAVTVCACWERSPQPERDQKATPDIASRGSSDTITHPWNIRLGLNRFSGMHKKFYISYKCTINPTRHNITWMFIPKTMPLKKSRLQAKFARPRLPACALGEVVLCSLPCFKASVIFASAVVKRRPEISFRKKTSPTTCSLARSSDVASCEHLQA